MSGVVRIVVFLLDGQRYGLRLEAVIRVIRAVELTPLPEAPPIVLGVIDVGGCIVPVFSLRRRFGLPERAIAASDQLILARAAGKPVALAVDESLGLVEQPAKTLTAASDVAGGLGLMQGAVATDDGLVFIRDLETFLSLEESRALEGALNVGATHAG